MKPGPTDPAPPREPWNPWEILRPLLRARGGGSGYLPWSEGALSPAALVEVANEIVFADRTEVVELGAGISTVVLGRLLADRGGRVTTLEHDPGWARVVRGYITREELPVRLVEAPLGPCDTALGDAPWYPAEALAELPAGGTDLLLVDGPPGYGEGMELSRYPALPALHSRLAPGALVVLDDVGRPGELEILRRWGEALPEWEFSAREGAGIAVGVRPGS